MSLGGYKFAGRFCQKGSLTNVQWALLMHKTKVAAFMAANALANAGWDYDMTGSPDGNYHCLDTVGNNYVTCFKRVVDADTTHYFCILTLTAYNAKSSPGVGYISTSTFLLRYIYNQNTYYLTGCNTAFVRAGVTPFSYDTAATSLDTGQSPMMPTGNPGPYARSWTSTSGNNNTTYSYLALSSVYFGFAIKGSSIVMFSGPSPSGIAISLVSENAYSEWFVEGSNTHKNFIYINFQCMVYQSVSTHGELDSAYFDSDTNGAKLTVVSTEIPNGNTWYNSYSANFSLVASPISRYTSTDIPFQGLTSYSYLNDSVSGTYACGNVNIDLVSMNFQPSQSSRLSVLANGKYLVAAVYKYTTPMQYLGYTAYSNGIINDSTIYGTFYVGWDASNPDITQASSWTEYRES